jgi:hypothetical protein
MTEKLPDCPVEIFLMFIGNKWSALILRDLMDGPQRFSQLQRSIGGITQKVLTTNLRQMEERGILTRTVYPEVPPRVEYELTEIGYSLQDVLNALSAWGVKYRTSKARTMN